MKRRNVFNVQIDGKEYAIKIKSGLWSKYIVIYVNDVERINVKIKYGITPFYRFTIENSTVMVSVTDGAIISHAYDVFVDGVSVITGEPLTKPLEDAKEFVKGGMIRHFKDNIKNFPTICIMLLAYFIFSFIFDGSYKEFKFSYFTIFAELAVVLIGSVIIFLGINAMIYFRQKQIIKNWDKQFIDEKENIS